MPISRQLITGLVIGAISTGLGVMLIGGSPEVEVVSETGNLKLLAQVIPNQASEEVGDAESVSERVSAEVIEVRSAAATKALPKTTATEVVSEEAAMEEEIAGEVALVAKKCAYITEDKPRRDGILSEVAWMGTGDDANAEWVEMQNRTKGDLDVSGWQLVDKAEQIRAIIPEGVVLSKSGFLIFERDEHQLAGATVLYKGAISNTDEGLRLFDADCNLQDEVIAKPKWPAGTNSPKRTAERAKDLSWHTYYGSGEAGILGTPGKKNSAGPPPPPEPEASKEEPEPATPEEGEPNSSEEESEPEAPAAVEITAGQLIISEVMAGTAVSADDEFIELYNTTGEAISLEGFSIRKKTSTGTESSFVSPTRFAGVSIAAGERLVIGREGKFSGASDITWPSSYSLAYASNAIVLLNAQSTTIDEVSWVDIPPGQSYACASQGSCAVQEVPNPGE